LTAKPAKIAKRNAPLEDIARNYGKPGAEAAMAQSINMI